MAIRYSLASGFLVAVLMGLGLGAPSAHAADSQGQFAVKGIGITKCSRLLESYDAKDRSLTEFGGWISGYLTALNRTNSKTFDLAPWQTTQFLVLALVNFCTQNPDVPVHQAVALMARSLEQDRLSERSEGVMLKEGGNEVGIYVAILQRVQSRLRDLGYYEGTVDGKFGPQTKAALVKLQRDQGFQETGLPDLATLKFLFYPS